MRAAFPEQGRHGLVEVPYDGAPATALDKADRRGDLRPHAASREMTISIQSLELGQADLLDLLLLRRAVVDCDTRYGGSTDL